MGEKELKDVKRKLDKLLGDEQLEAIKDVVQELKKERADIAKLTKKVESSTKVSQESKKLFKMLLKAVEAINLELPEEYQVEVKNQPVYPEEIKISNLKWPQSIDVRNFPKQQEIHIPDTVKVSNLDDIEIPKKTRLEKPIWWEQIKKSEMIDILDTLLEKLQRAGLKADLDAYRDAKRPIAVRLSNGRSFYEAIASVVSGGSTKFPFETTTGKAVAALVNNAGRLQVDIVTGGLSESIYAKKFDQSTVSVAYAGEANPGTAGSEAGWRIKRVLETGDLLEVEWADGEDNFTKTWDSRGSYSYGP